MQSNISEKYREIYEKEILQFSEGIIITYDPSLDKFLYQPFSHNSEDDCVQQLGKLMQKNLLFYCYGEDEIVTHYQKKHFKNPKQAARYAYNIRLPKRPIERDGLLGEVLLDLLIQLYEKDTYKLAVRPLMRQNDNIEIKGYDLTYFTSLEDRVTIWLGQAKMGQKEYCKNGIHKDLLEKFEKEYLAGELFFISDKQKVETEESMKITEIINEINVATLEENETERAKLLLKCFEKNNISINIPCLLAYEECDVYDVTRDIKQMIENQTEGMKKFFSRKEYRFEGFKPKIIMYIFPIKSITELRDKDKGFYNGLR